MSKFISDGAKFFCRFCSTTPELEVTSGSTCSGNERLASESNYSFSKSQGKCAVTSSKCIPEITECSPGQSTVKVDGSNALNESCSFSCQLGGTLSPYNPGQNVSEEV